MVLSLPVGGRVSKGLGIQCLEVEVGQLGIAMEEGPSFMWELDVGACVSRVFEFFPHGFGSGVTVHVKGCPGVQLVHWDVIILVSLHPFPFNFNGELVDAASYLMQNVKVWLCSRERPWALGFLEGRVIVKTNLDGPFCNLV